MIQLVDGEPTYPETTELVQEEKAWLFDYIFPDVMDLPIGIKKQMFHDLWASNVGECGTCGADEGHCTNSTCIRTRITNKLHLYERGS